jgi:hypothetical protein
MTRKREVASTMARAVDENLKRHGIRYIRGEARLVPEYGSVGIRLRERLSSRKE